jgi:hypothetical protein
MSGKRSLAKGQVWKTKDRHIQIVELEETLIHYKVQKEARVMGRTLKTVPETMLNYLKEHKAQLVAGVSTN